MRKLDNSALGDMRGKFIAPGGVSFFGLELQSSWQSADGVTTFATVVFNLGFAGGLIENATPQLLIGWTRSCDNCGDPSLDVPAPAATVPAGLNSVSGIVQTQIISGTDNKVRNSLSIAGLPSGQVSPKGGAGLQEVTSGSTKTFSDGDKIQFVIAPGEIGLTMTDTGGDLIRQSVGSELNQASQHVILNSSFNAISNAMAITVGLGELQQADQIQVNNAIGVMKGRGF
jgi:hypothetical protein